MKTFISDIIPKIQKFSHKLDNLTMLTNQHWVAIDDIENNKNVYIFRANNELLISHNGKIEKAKWEYLGNNSLLIERKEDGYLFKHGFFDENILALKIDSKNEYAFLVNESRFDEELNSLENITTFLNRNYIESQIKHSIQDAIGIKINPNLINGRYSNYIAPKHSVIKKSEDSSVFGRKTELYKITYEDGETGELYFKKKQAYFKDNTMAWNTLEHFYDSLDSGINALHYFIKTGKKLNEGYIITY